MEQKPSLSKGFFIYFIGNAGSKFIFLLLLPFITVYLSESEFGYFELVNTAVNLFVPVIALQTFEGVIRFLLDSKSDDEKNKVISTSFFIVIVNLLIFNLLFTFFSGLYEFEYKLYIPLYFNALFLYYYFQRIARGLQKQIEFSISGFLSAAGIAAACIVTFIFLNMKVDGIIISYFIGNFIAVLYLVQSLKVVKFVSIKCFNKKLALQIIKYSFPLLFDAIIWWVMNLSDRSVLSYFLGNDAVGIYGVSYKFAAILFFFNTIFYLTWQEYSIIQNNEVDKEKRFTEVFNKFFVIQITSVAALVPFSKIIITELIAPNYSDSFNYVPLLLGGTMFSSLAAFYGMKYQISKNTVSALVTSSIGGIINLVFNIIFIPVWGIWAAAGSTLLSFFVLWLVRAMHVSDFIDHSEVKFMKFILLTVYTIAISVSCYYVGYVSIIFIMFLTVLVFIYFNKLIIIDILKKVRVIRN